MRWTKIAEKKLHPIRYPVNLVSEAEHDPKINRKEEIGEVMEKKFKRKKLENLKKYLLFCSSCCQANKWNIQKNITQLVQLLIFNPAKEKSKFLQTIGKT